MISAKVILDSQSEEGKRITTFLLEYPRFIHSEFLTHRMFSRNAASSRAIPIEKMLERVCRDPAMPVFWGKNQKGMQAEEELSSVSPVSPFDPNLDPMVSAEEMTSPLLNAKIEWLRARDFAVMQVQRLLALGLHKQLANRLLEPWMHIAVLCTATEYGNFFNLRYHKAAQPEFQALAKAMYEAYQASTPKVLKVGEWHLPFITEADQTLHEKYLADDPLGQVNPWFLQQISAARCARLSYNNVDGTSSSIEADLALYERLMGGFPKHASPTEHQAQIAPNSGVQSGNFFGWTQFRKTIEGENLPIFPGPL